MAGTEKAIYQMHDRDTEVQLVGDLQEREMGHVIDDNVFVFQKTDGGTAFLQAGTDIHNIDTGTFTKGMKSTTGAFIGNINASADINVLNGGTIYTDKISSYGGATLDVSATHLGTVPATTLRIEATTGTFSSGLKSSTGSFSGLMKASTGSFDSNVNASGDININNGGTIYTDKISSYGGAALDISATHIGTVPATTLRIEATTGTFSGGIKSSTGSFSGAVNGSVGTFSDSVIGGASLSSSGADVTANDGYVDASTARSSPIDVSGLTTLRVAPSGASNDYFALSNKRDGQILFIRNTGGVTAKIDDDETGEIYLTSASDAVAIWNAALSSWIGVTGGVSTPT